MRSRILAFGLFLTLISGVSAWAETGPYYQSVPQGCVVQPDGSRGEAGPIHDARGFYVGYYRPAVATPEPTVVYQTVYQTVESTPPPVCDCVCAPPAPPAYSEASGQVNWNWLLGGDPPGGYSGF